MSFLQRISERFEGFYVDLAAVSLYHPEREANPARTRWKFIQRRIKDGSFFLLTRENVPIDLDQPIRSAQTFESRRNKRQSVSFDQVLSQAVKSVAKANKNVAGRTNGAPQSRGAPPNEDRLQPSRPRRLADAHTERAIGSKSTSNEDSLNLRAANKMSQFMTGKMKEIRRLSKVPINGLSLENAMVTYGNEAQNNRIAENSDEDSSLAENIPPVPVIPADYHRPAPSKMESLHHGGIRRGGGGSLTGSEYGGGYSRSGETSHKDYVPERLPNMRTIPARYAGSQYASSIYGDEATPSEAGTIRSTRRMPKSDLQSATFTRKLSMYKGGSSSSRAGDDDVPPVPAKQNHW